jgi:ribosome biogenesis GTPase A
MKISPKMKKTFAEVFGLDTAKMNKLCSKMNSLLEIRYAIGRNYMFALVPDLIEKLSENEFIAEKTLHGYITHGFSSVLFFFTLIEETSYSHVKIDEFIRIIKTAYEEGKIGYCFIENIQDSMTLLCDYHDKGNFQVRMKEPRKNRNLCDHFEELVDSYRNINPQQNYCVLIKNMLQ